MQDALTQIAGMHGSLPLLGQAVLKSALARNESRGAHWRSDYPQRNDAEFHKTTAAYYDGQTVHISWDAVPERRCAQMAYQIRIKRQSAPDTKSYWQEFSYDGSADASVAAVLNELNGRMPLTDAFGNPAKPISWECGCMVRKCGACAMRINGVPRLACSVFLNTLKGTTVTLEPLSKFPLVKDLVVDRSILFENMKKIELWLKSDAYLAEYTHEARYQSARCLMCGCCLEVCPNFSAEGSFAGAIAPVNVDRILNEEQDHSHREELSAKYKAAFFDGCGKSLSCQDICPAHIPVEELTVRSNAAAIWRR